LISFRYHVVSIVAVFLALALGVVVGTTVVNQGIIEDLRNRTDAAATNAENLRKEVDDLRNQLETDQAFENRVVPALVDGQLAGSQVTLVTQSDVDPAEVEGVRRVLEESGVTLTGEVVVTNRMSLTEARWRSDLAGAMGTVDSGIPEQLAQEAAVALAARLADGPSSVDPDLLNSLSSAGFIVITGGASGAAGVGGPEQSVVLLAGNDRDSTLDPGLFLVPLATALVGASRVVAAAETQDSFDPFVQLLRADGQLDGRMVTVDNADQAPGRVALVYGLRDLLASPGNGGNYGVKPGASALLPNP
jgi:Copper transport outer membrane protein, MctB